MKQNNTTTRHPSLYKLFGLDKINQSTSTMLIEAVKEKNLLMAETLISKYADLDQIDKLGFTPLHMAAINKDIDMIALLIKSGANINIEDAFGKNPIYYSIKYNDFKSFKYLIEQKNIFPIIDNINRDSIAHITAKYNRIRMLGLLIKNRNSINSRNIYNQKPYDIAITNSNLAIAQILKKLEKHHSIAQL